MMSSRRHGAFPQVRAASQVEERATFVRFVALLLVLLLLGLLLGLLLRRLVGSRLRVVVVEVEERAGVLGGSGGGGGCRGFLGRFVVHVEERAGRFLGRPRNFRLWLRWGLGLLGLDIEERATGRRRGRG